MEEKQRGVTVTKKQIRRVFDVRTSPEIRKQVEEIVKEHNAQKGSKFFKPTTAWFGNTYNQSLKPKKAN